MWLRKIKKIWICILLICIFFVSNTMVFANNDVVTEIKEAYDLNGVIDLLENYTESIEIRDVANNLLKGEKINATSILDMFSSLLFKEIRIGITTFIRLLIVIVLIAIVKCLELGKGSLDKIVNLMTFLVTSTMILKNYIDVVEMFKNTISSLTKITEIVSPTVLALLIATGEVVTSGIIGPLIMFLTAICGVMVSSIILPLINIMLVFKIISGISESINLERLGSFLNKFAMWTTSIVFALILGVLGLETSVSTSVDSVTVKTTQAAVSNLIPVVGKFVSDSAEIVMGASEIIGKTVGVLGIIAIIIALSVPALKMFALGIIYGALEGISEALIKENKTTKLIGAFSKQYNTLAGIMVGVGSVFIIALALAVSLFGKAVAS